MRYLPQLLWNVQKRSGRQVMISTHASGLLRDDGIGLDEVLLLQPGKEGTAVRTAGEQREIRALLEGGIDLADAALPHTRPGDAEQLPLFMED